MFYLKWDEEDGASTYQVKLESLTMSCIAAAWESY